MSIADEFNAASGRAPVPGSLSVKWFINAAFCVLKKKLLGRVLTIVDASMSDAQQRKAVKDIVREAFNSTHELEREIAEYARKTAHQTFEGGDEFEPISVVLGEISPIFTDDYVYSCEEVKS
ncbi:MAG: hypothetical protein DWQ49_08950 [Bacteroidetes bacterium]|nr:MAG: hypothetical protein DWQ49_08950 [Bacteroidota bacterium]